MGDQEADATVNLVSQEVHAAVNAPPPGDTAGDPAQDPANHNQPPINQGLGVVGQMALPSMQPPRLPKFSGDGSGTDMHCFLDEGRHVLAGPPILGRDGPH
ncbi:hypothetical protein BaRGS_00034247 [Batillaria attramentaria]|uniref:Uncharacterized protein n=1 Tax=Batillaria attramentaria TaxID=370345 RepID=A0ABD0JI82_9CAEN